MPAIGTSTTPRSRSSFRLRSAATIDNSKAGLERTKIASEKPNQHGIPHSRYNSARRAGFLPTNSRPPKLLRPPYLAVRGKYDPAVA